MLNGLTLKDVAKKTDVDPSHISRIEKNERLMPYSIKIVFGEDILWAERFFKMVCSAIEECYDHETAELLIDDFKRSMDL